MKLRPELPDMAEVQARATALPRGPSPPKHGGLPIHPLLARVRRKKDRWSASHLQPQGLSVTVDSVDVVIGC